MHARTLPLCESFSFREWSGYVPCAYEAHHEHEHNAIRNAAVLVAFKYTSPDRRGAFVDRAIARDAHTLDIGQVQCVDRTRRRRS